MQPAIPLALIASLALASCASPEEEIVAAFDGIGENETITLGGTEPFWGATIDGGSLTYATPDAPDGKKAQVTRFAGNGGLSFTGTLDGQDLTALVTPGECSDGMSDFVYPYVATLQIGEVMQSGCAHTDKQPYRDPAQG